MIADINKGSNLYGALAYNQEKIDKGLGRVLDTNLIRVPLDGQFHVAACQEQFEQLMPEQITTSKPVIHISLNPHLDDHIPDEKMAEIGRGYMEKLGYGDQPYMIFKHEDIDRWHLHIVSINVRSDGTLISDSNNYKRSREITDALEVKYGLHSKEKKQGEKWELKPVDVAAGNLKKQVANAIKPLGKMYKFQSLSEYRALLSLYNIGVEKVEGNNEGHKYTGLVYSALDKDGNREGKPLKSSLFGKQFGMDGLEQMMKKSGEEIKAKSIVASTRAIVSTSLKEASSENEFREKLRDKGIDTVLRHNDQGRLFGVTFIDHNERAVLNGSALGKEFSANVLSARFADFSQHEDMQTPTNTAPIQPDDHRKPSAPAPFGQFVSDASSQPDHSGNPLGGILSVLTPETDGQDNNQAMPTPRKKKKRRYGRQM